MQQVSMMHKDMIFDLTQDVERQADRGNLIRVF